MAFFMTLEIGNGAVLKSFSSWRFPYENSKAESTRNTGGKNSKIPGGFHKVH